MSSGNLTQRMMAGAEDANDDIANKSFHHTVQPTVPPAAEQLIAASSGVQQPQNGSDMHAILMERARHKDHLDETLGDTRQFFDYKNSSVGNIGGDREIRRELTIRSRQERLAREKRFGHRRHHAPGTRTTSDKTSERQRYNSTGSQDSPVEQTGTRQEFNTQAPEPRTTFREPPARGYNPYA